MAVIIGSDAWPGGVPSLGATLVHRYLTHIKRNHVSPDGILDENAVFGDMIKWASSEASYPKGTSADSRFSEEAIRILVDAILYEPVNARVSNHYDKGHISLSEPKWQYILGSK